MEDYYSCSKVFNHIPNLNPDDILNESFYLLKKQLSEALKKEALQLKSFTMILI